MATIYKTNGEKIETKPKNGKYFKLDELKEIVGGWIQILYISEKEIMIVNDEGLIKQLPVNINASKILMKKSHVIDYVVGDVIVCKRSEIR